MKYEYKFVEIDAPTLPWRHTPKQEEYRKIICDKAQEGWRLVQIFAPGTSFYGSAAYFELIFEREITE